MQSLPPPATPVTSPAINRPAVFATVALALLMMSIDSTIVATVLHTLQTELNTSVNWAGWTITAYALGFAVMLPVTGRLSERYGRRTVFLASVVTFTLASLACGLAGDIHTLIVLRAVQAAGGAGFTPSATGIIVDHFGPGRDRAVSLFGSIFPIGAMLGPIFGGLILTQWSWRAVFFVNLPIGAAVILLALFLVPRDHPEIKATDFRMDYGGLALFGTGLLAIMLAISYLGEHSSGRFAAILPAALVAIAALALWRFVAHVRHHAQPFIAPYLIYGRNFGVVNLVNMVLNGIPIGMMALVPLYATSRYGFDEVSSASLLIAQGVATILLSITATLALRRTGYRAPLYVGTGFSVIGMLLFALAPLAGISAYWWLAGSALFVGAGLGVVNPASRNAGLQLAPEQATMLAALRSLAFQLGAIATVSVTTAFMTAAHDAALAQTRAFIAIALVLVIALPLVPRISEHRGSW